MRDTSDEIEEVYRQRLMALSPEGRFEKASSMFDFARGLATAAVTRELGPSADPRLVRENVFLRIYGPDFDAVTLEKVLEHLRTLPEPS